MGEQSGDGVGGRGHIRVAKDHEGRRLCERNQAQQRLRDHDERSLRAHEHLGQVAPIFRQEMFQGVARDLARKAAKVAADVGEVGADQRGQALAQLPLPQTAATSGKSSPCAVDALKRQHIIGRAPPGHSMRAASVVSDHAAESRAVLRGRIRPKAQTVYSGRGLQVAHHHTRLHPRSPRHRVNFEDLIHVPGKVQHHARAYRIARHRRATTARRQRHAALPADLQHGRYLGIHSSLTSTRIDCQGRCYPEAAAVLEICRERGVALTSRGGGTSVAGNAVGPGVVLDFSRHMNKILEIDPVARTARVQPGVVMSDLQAAAAVHGLRFGPDPSTQNRATLGGMIGNNACGPHAVAWGRTADNVLALECIDGAGRAFTAGSGSLGKGELGECLAALICSHLADIRRHFGRFSRQVSGYSLEHLLPENGRDLAKMLVGSEGTLVVITQALLRLVPLAQAPTLVVLGYPDMPAAADAVPALLAHAPLAVEGIDAELVEVVRRKKGAVPALPAGGGWLFIEVGAQEGEDVAVVDQRVAAIVRDAGTADVVVCPPGPEAAELWRIRADGAGLGGRTPAGEAAWPGWEDSAVPPEKLGPYLRDLRGLMSAKGLDGLMYGHFGDGCVHVRIDFPLEEAGGVPLMRAFMEEATDIAMRYGGSMSGEHGDGRARSELLTRMYPPQILELFGAVKALFDPDDVLNPGVLVRPRPLDADLRRPQAAPSQYAGGFHFREDGGDFTRAVHRCTGVGNCRANRTAAGFYMCPSYQATKDEKDVTRGRARVLQE
ncbi:glycolate oxidase subunit GlcD [Trueperella pyogenes]|nr:glycolate oxidase subunit GlcD [Trueperella pyogenes]